MNDNIMPANPEVNARKSTARWNPRVLLVAPLVLVGLGGIVPFGGGSAPLIAALSGHVNAVSKVTIIARADGTFDIKEFPTENQWFAPDVVGEGMKLTVAKRFGEKVAPSSVNVLVQADPGTSDESVRVALASARTSGFVHFGFLDPRLGEVVTQFAQEPVMVTSSR